MYYKSCLHESWPDRSIDDPPIVWYTIIQFSFTDAGTDGLQFVSYKEEN